jgi:hypothetical protein
MEKDYNLKNIQLLMLFGAKQYQLTMKKSHLSHMLILTLNV